MRPRPAPRRPARSPRPAARRPSHPARRRALPALLGAALALAALAPSPAAQSPQWVEVLPGSPAGSEAIVELVPSISNQRETYVDVRIPGYWREDVLGDDGTTYQRITVPGLPNHGVPGEPQLPVVRLALGMASAADTITLASANAQQVVFHSGIRVLPAPVPGEDEEHDPSEDPGPGDTTGSDPAWVAPAPAIYASAAFWPAAPTDLPQPVMPMLGPVNGGAVELHPFMAAPAPQRLKVNGFTRYKLLHLGNAVQHPALTLPTAKLAGQVFFNWPAVEDKHPVETTEYHARYLILARPWQTSTLAPFVLHKQKLGFDVTVITSTSTNAGTLRGLVQGWYDQGAANEEHYVLLVGDADTVPQIPVLAPGFAVVPSDDPYGLLVGLHSLKRCFVGRLSVDDTSDLANQLQKIMQYELNPEPFGRYDRALLVAHKEGAPGKYTGAHESVRTASYSHPPEFLTRYGANNEPNFLVLNDIGNEVGVVAYRGHGSTRTWSDWNTLGQNFHVNEVLDLFNDEVLPVVWSISCTNSNIAWTSDDVPSADSIGEVWLEAEDKGAVAHYGATVTTSTQPNHDLDRLLFHELYDEGNTIHGQLVEIAEFKLQVLWYGHKNPWAYMLLGDPSMVVRREVVDTFQILLPPGFAMPDDPGTEYDLAFNVSDSNGLPVSEALVSLFKPSPLAGHAPEIALAHWTDAFGQVDPIVQPLTPGPIFWTARDLEGNLSQGVVQVGLGPAWTDLGEALPGTHGAPTLTGVGSLQPGSFAGIYLGGARENAQGFLCVGLGQANLPFKGGVLVPDIFGAGGFFKPLGTDAAGGRALETSWPAGVPSGVPLTFQWWIADPAAPAGFAASNGLQGLTP